jgi:hypothetical protein
MAYFSHAFKKTIIMSDFVQATATTTGALASGEVALFDARAWTPIDATGPDVDCCQFIIAAGTPYQNDRIGPFHGGYQESIKSKGIQPKYITKYWNQDSNAAQQSILHIGTTPFTAGTADCCPEFVCGENYHLRVDVKGNPVLRTLNHQGYVEVTAYGGCCPDDAVEPVQINPVEIMLQWQQGIVESVVVTGNGPNGRTNPEPFIIPVVTVSAAGAAGAIGDQATLIYPEGTDAAVLAAGVAATNAHLGLVGPATVIATTADAYTAAAYTDECAGLTLVGAYVDTQFGDCTFQPSDFYGLEPIRIYASEVDLNGDPCAFTGICVVSECEGRQAQGLGETALRDLILSEEYRQNHFSTDLRIREITQGTDLLGTGPGQVNRNALYDRTLILHSVPRFNNPSGTFDNDQYIVEVLTEADGGASEAARDALRTAINDLLTNCGDAECAILPANAEVACDAPSVVVTA